MGSSDILPILSGDGDSEQTPINFAPSAVGERVSSERAYIEQRFGIEGQDWTEQMHYTSMQLHSVWALQLAKGDLVRVYFDTKGTIYED